MSSTNSTDKGADAREQSSEKSMPHDGHPQMTKEADGNEKTEFTAASSEAEPSKVHADQTTQMKTEEKEKQSASQPGNGNMASGRSTLVEEDIKKQLKRLKGDAFLRQGVVLIEGFRYVGWILHWWQRSRGISVSQATV